MVSRFAARRAIMGCLLLAVVTSCGADGDATTAPPEEQPEPVPNFIRLESDPGEYIGAGSTYDYANANAIISVTTSGGYISLTIDGDESWRANIWVPQGALLLPGTYANVTSGFQPSTGAMNWSSEGRSCNSIGSFTIDSSTYVGAVLTAIDVRFEQHCTSAAATLRGTVHWRADDTSGPAGPVEPIPGSLWRPDTALLPKSGNYVLLSTESGEYFGQDVSVAYTSPASPVSVVASGGQVAVRVADWNGTFVAMLGVQPMKVGYYGGLTRYPFHNKAKGGLDWSGYATGCNRLTGWFAVDRIVFNGTTLTALDLRFEQDCSGLLPPVHGVIHWSG